jgi:hypothetical protein
MRWPKWLFFGLSPLRTDFDPGQARLGFGGKMAMGKDFL